MAGCGSKANLVKCVFNQVSRVILASPQVLGVSGQQQIHRVRDVRGFVLFVLSACALKGVREWIEGEDVVGDEDQDRQPRAGDEPDDNLSVPVYDVSSLHLVRGGE